MQLFISEEDALEIHNTINEQEYLKVSVIDPLYLTSIIPTRKPAKIIELKQYTATYIRKEFCFGKSKMFVYILEGAEDLAMNILDKLYKDL